MCRLQRRVIEASAGYDQTGVFKSCGVTSAKYYRCLVEHISFEFSERVANSFEILKSTHTDTHSHFLFEDCSSPQGISPASESGAAQQR